MTSSYLFVRSQDRSIGTSSAFSVTLPTPYRSVKSVSLVSCELPFALYNVDVPYTQGVRFAHNSVIYDMSLTPGFYQITDLQSAMLSNLQTAFPSAGISSVLYSAITGKLSIVYSSGLSFAAASSSAGMLGRIIGTDPLGSTTLAAGGVLSFPYLVSLFPVSTILMKVAELPSQCATTNNTHAFARLQLSSTPGSIVMHNVGTSVINTSTFSNPIPTLSTLTISLFTADNQAISLHGCEWSFALLIQAN